MKTNSIYLILSDDSKFNTNKVNDILTKHHVSDDATYRFNLLDDSLDQVLEALDTYGLFDNKKGIIVSQPLFLTNEKCSVTDKEIEHLSRYFSSPNEEHILIFIVDKVDERKKIVKQLKKVAQIVEFKVDIPKLVDEYLTGYQIENKAKSLLIELCNDDSNKLYQECKKLKLYKLDTKKILVTDVELLVEPQIDNSDHYLFSFINTMVLNDKKKALEIYHNLLNQGLDPIAIIALLSNQYRLLLQVKLLLNEGYNKGEIAKQLQVHPYRVEKAITSCRSYHEEDLISYLDKFANMDYEIKSGQIEANLALELFILEY